MAKSHIAIIFAIQLPPDLESRLARAQARVRDDFNDRTIEIDRPLAVDLVTAVEGFADVLCRMRAVGALDDEEE